ALAVDCGGSIPGSRRTTMRCVSQWIHSFCDKSSGTVVEEYGLHELMTRFRGSSVDLLESILSEAFDREDEKRVIVIRDPTVCLRAADDAASHMLPSSAESGSDVEDDEWDDSHPAAASSLDSSVALALWLTRSVARGLRIIFLSPSAAVAEMLGQSCSLIRLSGEEIHDLVCYTEEPQARPSGPLVDLLTPQHSPGQYPTGGGVICVYGPSGSGKTNELRKLKSCVSSGKATEVRVADIVAAELGESQSRLRKVYSELASCSRFSPATLAVAMFDDCDLWVNSAGKVMGEVLSQWTTLLDTHCKSVLTVITCEDREKLPQSLSCRVTNWISLADDSDGGNTCVPATQYTRYNQDTSILYASVTSVGGPTKEHCPVCQRVYTVKLAANDTSDECFTAIIAPIDPGSAEKVRDELNDVCIQSDFRIMKGSTTIVIKDGEYIGEREGLVKLEVNVQDGRIEHVNAKYLASPNIEELVYFAVGDVLSVGLTYQGATRDFKTVCLILEPSRREVVLQYEKINRRNLEFWDRNSFDSPRASKPESDFDALTGGKINAKKGGVKMAKSIIKGLKGKIKGKP
ncbi:hypothetical protein FOZ62_018848, partial [Perkinsus olseni]